MSGEGTDRAARADERHGVPLEGGPSDAFVRERASATPQKHAGAPPAVSVRGAQPAITAVGSAVPKLDVPLRALQHWFAGAVMHPGGVAAGVESTALNAMTSNAGAHRTSGSPFAIPLADVERVLLPSRHLAGIDRLAVYGEAYRARLVECLADDYPALKYALGDEPFESLCLRYMARHPSESPNLNFFGRHMAVFCRAEAASARAGQACTGAGAELFAFAADLAALEWALVEVLHAASPERLALASLAAIPTEQWAGVRFVPGGAVRVLEFDHPVNVFFQAFRTDRAPRVPAPAWSATAIFRDGTTIWRMDLSRAMHALLAALCNGTPLGQALDALAQSGAVSEKEEAQVMVWFRDWIGHGFFAGIESR